MYHGALAMYSGMCGLMSLPVSSTSGRAVPAFRASSSAFRCLYSSLVRRVVVVAVDDGGVDEEEEDIIVLFRCVFFAVGIKFIEKLMELVEALFGGETRRLNHPTTKSIP